MVSLASLHNSVSLLSCSLAYSKVKLACFSLDLMFNLDCLKYFLKSSIFRIINSLFILESAENNFTSFSDFTLLVKSPELGMCIYLEILLYSPGKVKKREHFVTKFSFLPSFSHLPIDLDKTKQIKHILNFLF